MDKISIITASYNCVDEIEKTIQSVLEQDYPLIEYIIIDGGSDDGTIDIIKKYENRISFWISEPDDGLYFAMNKGISHATGDWVYIHNAGGVFYEPTTLSKMFSCRHDDADAIFGYNWSTKDQCFYRNPVPFYLQEKRDKRPGYSHQALFVRTEWCKKYPFDTTYKCCADFNQAIQIWENGGRFKYIDIPVVISALPGFSARHRRLQAIENARINGLEKSWSLKYRLLKLRIKELLNTIGLFH